MHVDQRNTHVRDKDTGTMLRPQTGKSTARSAFSLLEVIFHASIRKVRKSHRNAAFGLFMNMVQSMIFVGVFLMLFFLLGIRGASIRGDYMLFIMSGVFMFMTHTKTIGAVSGAENSTSPMMKHAPMNTIVSIGAAALSTLYIQVLSACSILFLYHVIWQPITIDQPVGTIAMFLLAWASGLAIGMVFLAAQPWNPNLFGTVSTIYQRLNMIFSGKMFVANVMSTTMLVMFIWNPLFHIIDQARGFIFLNYTPHNTSIAYPVKFTVACLLIGLMAEFYTRKHASASWSAGQ